MIDIKLTRLTTSGLRTNLLVGNKLIQVFVVSDRKRRPIQYTRLMGHRGSSSLRICSPPNKRIIMTIRLYISQEKGVRGVEKTSEGLVKKGNRKKEEEEEKKKKFVKFSEERFKFVSNFHFSSFRSTDRDKSFSIVIAPRGRVVGDFRVLRV